jgi:hypothetical protein
MPGARLRAFRLGDRSEQLVEFLLSSFAFTTAAPRQEDVGADFFCSLIAREGELLKAGPFFTVQAKSKPDPIIFEKEHEVAWITRQENPLFLCIADRVSLAMDVYSTWNLLCGPLYRKPSRIILLPGVSGGAWPGINYKEDGTQEIYLGCPIVRISASEIFDDAKVEQLSAVIRDWAALDRTNIVNVNAGMYWVQGPLSYKTGELPYADGKGSISFYWHPNNLRTCSANLGRAVTLGSHWELFDEPVKQFLIQQGLNPKDS